MFMLLACPFLIYTKLMLPVWVRVKAVLSECVRRRQPASSPTVSTAHRESQWSL